MAGTTTAATPTDGGGGALPGVAPDHVDLPQRLGQVPLALPPVERHVDRAGRERLREIVQALLELHAAGLEKILTEVDSLGEAGREVIERLARDELVSSLFVLHGLHPLDV